MLNWVHAVQFCPKMRCMQHGAKSYQRAVPVPNKSDN